MSQLKKLLDNHTPYMDSCDFVFNTCGGLTEDKEKLLETAVKLLEEELKTGVFKGDIAEQLLYLINRITESSPSIVVNSLYLYIISGIVNKHLDSEDNILYICLDNIQCSYLYLIPFLDSYRAMMFYRFQFYRSIVNRMAFEVTYKNQETFRQYFHTYINAGDLKNVIFTSTPFELIYKAVLKQCGEEKANTVKRLINLEIRILNSYREKELPCLV